MGSEEEVVEEEEEEEGQGVKRRSWRTKVRRVRIDH